MSVLRWLGGAFVPAALALLLLYKSDKRREPAWLLGLTAGFAGLLALGCFFIEARVNAWTDLDATAGTAGQPGSLILVFALVAPMREAAKVAATWPAFRSPHFDEPYDGIVYAGAAALGFATVQNAWLLAHSTGGLAWVRSLLGLPAGVFFASTWGYALGRAKQAKQPARSSRPRGSSRRRRTVCTFIFCTDADRRRWWRWCRCS